MNLQPPKSLLPYHSYDVLAGSVSLYRRIRQGLHLTVMAMVFMLHVADGYAERNKEKPPSFGEYYPAFKDVCHAIADDNMTLEFYQILTSLIETPTSECLACKNFFRGFASSCRPKPSTSPTKVSEKDTQDSSSESVDEVEQTPTPLVIKKPPLPSLEVIDALSALGNALSEDHLLENFLPTVVAVFNKRLVGNGEKGNRYFYTMAVYVNQSMSGEPHKENGDTSSE